MKTKDMVFHTAIVAIYVTLTLILGNFSFGLIQIRLSEAMLVLCLIKKDYIWTLTLACLISNCLGVALGLNPFALDIIIGTVATLISNYLIYRFRNILVFNKPVISLIMPAIINAIFIGYELTFYINTNNLFIFNALYIGLGELLSCLCVGLIIYEPLKHLVESKDEL